MRLRVLRVSVVDVRHRLLACPADLLEPWPGLAQLDEHPGQAERKPHGRQPATAWRGVQRIHNPHVSCAAACAAVSPIKASAPTSSVQAPPKAVPVTTTYRCSHIAASAPTTANATTIEHVRIVAGARPQQGHRHGANSGADQHDAEEIRQVQQPARPSVRPPPPRSAATRSIRRRLPSSPAARPARTRTVRARSGRSGSRQSTPPRPRARGEWRRESGGLRAASNHRGHHEGARREGAKLS